MSQPDAQNPAEQPEAEPSDSRSLASDTEGMCQAIESFRPYLLGVANKEIAPVLRPKGGASDIVQETFMEAHRDLSQFAGRSKNELKGWLKRILRNNLANFVRRYYDSDKRRLAREVSIDQETPGGLARDGLVSSSISPSNQAILSEQAARLDRALSRLKERDRLVLIWRNHDYCGWKEIGRRVGGSEDKARKIWTRAVEQLRREVGYEYEDDPPRDVSGLA